uniref:uncharacterized protein LOC118530831 n=1 Tax=Halichoerus grypus TaxID=9711 RepID=UPI0016596978|nr:uncharacterized protein LOC118530831 [Halichoerus grypus]
MAWRRKCWKEDPCCGKAERNESVREGQTQTRRHVYGKEPARECRPAAVGKEHRTPVSGPPLVCTELMTCGSQELLAPGPAELRSHLRWLSRGQLLVNDTCLRIRPLLPGLVPAFVTLCSFEGSEPLPLLESISHRWPETSGAGALPISLPRRGGQLSRPKANKRRILSHLGFWCCKSEKQTYPFGTVEGLSFSELKLGHLGIWRIKLQTPCRDSHLATGCLDPFSHTRGIEEVLTAGIEGPWAVGGAQAAQDQALQGGPVVATLLRSWSPCAHLTDYAPEGCDWVTPSSPLMLHILSEDDLGTMYTGSPVAKGPSMVVMRRRGCQAVILAES